MWKCCCFYVLIIQNQRIVAILHFSSHIHIWNDVVWVRPALNKVSVKCVCMRVRSPHRRAFTRTLFVLKLFVHCTHTADVHYQCAGMQACYAPLWSKQMLSNDLTKAWYESNEWEIGARSKRWFAFLKQRFLYAELYVSSSDTCDFEQHRYWIRTW